MIGLCLTKFLVRTDSLHTYSVYGVGDWLRNAILVRDVDVWARIFTSS
jgi:hypothetical protein